MSRHSVVFALLSFALLSHFFAPMSHRTAGIFALLTFALLSLRTVDPFALLAFALLASHWCRSHFCLSHSCRTSLPWRSVAESSLVAVLKSALLNGQTWFARSGTRVVAELGSPAGLKKKQKKTSRRDWSSELCCNREKVVKHRRTSPAQQWTGQDRRPSPAQKWTGQGR